MNFRFDKNGIEEMKKRYDFSEYLKEKEKYITLEEATIEKGEIMYYASLLNGVYSPTEINSNSIEGWIEEYILDDNGDPIIINDGTNYYAKRERKYGDVVIFKLAPDTLKPILK